MKNQYYNNYINLIYQWNTKIILQANLKSLTILIQNKFLKGKNYQQLNDLQKSQLQNNINNDSFPIGKSINTDEGLLKLILQNNGCAFIYERKEIET